MCWGSSAGGKRALPGPELVCACVECVGSEGSMLPDTVSTFFVLNRGSSLNVATVSDRLSLREGSVDKSVSDFSSAVS